MIFNIKSQALKSTKVSGPVNLVTRTDVYEALHCRLSVTSVHTYLRTLGTYTRDEVETCVSEVEMSPPLPDGWRVARG